MPARLLHTPTEVRSRLQYFGLSREDLLDVVAAMIAARNSCTANHPPGSGGWRAWSDGTARLRDILIPLGWESSEDGQISSVINRDRNLRIAVMNTDDGTGVQDVAPQNRNKKGAATDRAVADNQLEFWEPNQDFGYRKTDTYQHWYLCVFSDGESVRAELSCPVSCENGYLTRYSERIFLISDDNAGGVTAIPEVPDNDTPIEVEISRKQA